MYIELRHEINSIHFFKQEILKSIKVTHNNLTQ